MHLYVSQDPAGGYRGPISIDDEDSSKPSTLKTFYLVWKPFQVKEEQLQEILSVSMTLKRKNLIARERRVKLLILFLVLTIAMKN